MTVEYDPDVDVLRILLSKNDIEESDEVEPGFIVDYDSAGAVVGLEVLHASHKVESLQTVEVRNMTPVSATS